MNKKYNILIVEDEMEFAELVKDRLEMSGYKASIAIDAYSGTREALKNDYELIILDLMMPAGGGLSILERIRKFPSKSTLPVVILTGKPVDEDLKLKAAQYKVSAIFTKPYSTKEFIHKIRSLLPLSHA
jgi:DNA-binding response OmpR family regulator